MSRILKVILFIIFFGLFFEAGLISSYTIVTSQPPDVGKLVNMQLEEISSFFNLGSNSNVLSNQATITILNPYDVAATLNSTGAVNSIDVKSLVAMTSDDTSNDVISVNITATGYKDTTSGGNTSAIVISPSSTYSITATAMGKPSKKGITIDLSTIKITSVRKLYGNTTSP
ncbi:hypothetical protein [Methanobacterium aggregans]|uniref:hypothetical protein n=1 Tax=Methanobacterium aggregans TaxID=1615586 RepID=UPI00320F6B39